MGGKSNQMLKRLCLFIGHRHGDSTSRLKVAFSCITLLSHDRCSESDGELTASVSIIWVIWGWPTYGGGLQLVSTHWSEPQTRRINRMQMLTYTPSHTLVVFLR